MYPIVRGYMSKKVLAELISSEYIGVATKSKVSIVGLHLF